MNEESIFAAVLKLSDPNDRQVYLDQACGADTRLRSQVEALLRASNDAGSFFEHPPEGMATIAAIVGEQETLKSGPATGMLPVLQPCETPGRIGKLVGKAGEYEVLEVVGQGGMGTVLRALDTKLNRIVALKVLAPELAANPLAVKRFLREAQSAAAIHHDHIVTIHAIDDNHRPPFIVMQFVEGQTLEQKIRQHGALQLTPILQIGSQIAAGLAAAHEQGLIHRDVKPANILLEKSAERVKITDFGLARAADDLELTQTGLIAGTPQYMSPEQAKGETIDSRSDLFSLGSVLYSMCTGQPAFRAESALAVMRRVSEETPRPIRELNPSVPAWLAAIVDQLLAKDPKQRYQNAGELATLLGRHLADVQHPRFADAETTDQPPLRPGRSTRKGWKAAAAMAAILLAGTLFTEALGITQMAATIVRIVRGDGTIVIKVDDPKIKVTLDGRDIVITEPGEYETRVRPGEHRIAAWKEGQSLHVDQPIVSIRRHGREVVSVSLEANAQPTAAPNQAAPVVAAASAARPRNPFGLADVNDPDGADVQEYAKTVSLGGGSEDANAAMWPEEVRFARVDSIDGDWSLRWKGPKPENPWIVGTATVVSVGDRVYILTKDESYSCLIDARRVGNNRLVGRQANTQDPHDTYPWVGRIVSPERIDGDWGQGRMDLRRKVQIVRNPFGVADIVESIDSPAVREFSRLTTLPGDAHDINAPLWTNETGRAPRGSIEGRWGGRWNTGPDQEWFTSTAQIKIQGDRVYILFGDRDYLIEARWTDKDRLVGRYHNIHALEDSTPWVGCVVSPERIDGQWGATPPRARWDFRRSVK